MRKVCLNRSASIFLALILAANCPLANAKKTKKLPPPHFIQQVPKLDTTFLPKPTHFELKIKHTDIVYAPDPAKMLHGKARVIDLHVEDNSNILRGRVQQSAAGPLNTVEHGVRGKFHLDLQAMTAKLAPDLSYQLSAAMDRARKRDLAARAMTPSTFEPPQKDVSLAGKAVDEKIAAAAQHPAMPKAAPIQDWVSNLGDQMNKVLGSVKIASLPIPLVQVSSQHMEGAKLPDDLRMPEGKVPAANGDVFGQLQKPKTVSSQAFDTNKTKIAVDPFAKADPSNIDPHVDGRILNKEQRDAQVNAQLAQPKMNAILTTLGKIMPAEPKQADTNISADLEETIDWQSWHQNFADLARGPLLKNMEQAHNPAGHNTVEITVYSSNSLAVTVVQPSKSKAFDAAICSAYQSLAKNSELRFPAGSRRTSIVFRIDNTFNGGGTPSAVHSDTTKDDRELIRSHFH